MSGQADIATAFATHDFDAAAPYLADDVRWVALGGATLTGKGAVSEAYRGTSAEVAQTSTRFRELRAIEAENCAVVQSVGENTEPDGAVSVVASCDILDIADGPVTAISSYTVGLPPSEQR